jgi:hypothetical protein
MEMRVVHSEKLTVHFLKYALLPSPLVTAEYFECVPPITGK